MRYLLALFAVLTVTATCTAQDVLPFGVTIGGEKAAMTERSTIWAALQNPVAANAAMSVEGVEGQIIVNIFPANENGEATQGAQPLILLFDASGSKTLGENMQGTAVAPGWYLTNVVGGGQTSRVVFQVK